MFNEEYLVSILEMKQREWHRYSIVYSKVSGEIQKEICISCVQITARHIRKPVTFNLGLRGQCDGVKGCEGMGRYSSFLSPSHVNSPQDFA